MKVKDFIEKLQEMPQDMNINIFDYRKNMYRGGGDSCSDGVCEITSISIVPDEETFSLMLENGEDIFQWVAIDYENDDYEDGFILSSNIEFESGAIKFGRFILKHCEMSFDETGAICYSFYSIDTGWHKNLTTDELYKIAVSEGYIS